jgi:Ca-activated chloride channel family protein
MKYIFLLLPIFLLTACGTSAGGIDGSDTAIEVPVGDNATETESGEEQYSEFDDNAWSSDSSLPSTFSIDVDTASYTNILRFIYIDNQLPPVSAVKIEEMINYFDYNYSNRDEELKIFTEIGRPFWREENLLLKIGLKANEIAKENLPQSNLVFLIDVSGSMSDYIYLIQESLKMVVSNLGEEDKISIVTYGGFTEVLLNSTENSMENREEIFQTIENLSAGGSSNGIGGIQLAYNQAENNFLESGNNRVILITDGDFNVGLTSSDKLEDFISAKRRSGVYLSVIGVGTDNFYYSKVETLAQNGNGNLSYINTYADAKKVFLQEMNSNFYTIGKDVKVQVQFDPEKIASYRLIGYENRALTSDDFENESRDAGDIGSEDTVTALYEIVPTENLTFGDEVASIEVRYKSVADSEVSRVVEKSALFEDIDESIDFRFVSAVASFGMILRESPYRDETSLTEIIEVTEASLGEDRYLYRKEFLDLLKYTESLNQ